MKNKAIKKVKYFDNGGILRLQVGYFHSKNRPTVYYRVGDGIKRWNKSYGPFPHIRAAILDFDQRNLTRFPMIFERDYAFFTNLSHTQYDGVVTLKVRRTDLGFYCVLAIQDKVIWSDSGSHNDITNAIISANEALSYLYPKVEPYRND